MQPSIDEQIRARAYQLWELDGRPSGRDQHHWFLAATELAAASIKPARKRTTGTKRAVKAKAIAA